MLMGVRYLLGYDYSVTTIDISYPDEDLDGRCDGTLMAISTLFLIPEANFVLLRF